MISEKSLPNLRTLDLSLADVQKVGRIVADRTLNLRLFAKVRIRSWAAEKTHSVSQLVVSKK